MAPAPGAARQSTANQASPAAITIHIHQMPGENSGDLARRVADELERRQAIAARGSYRDDV